MREHLVELWVERQMDRLDERYMDGLISREEYDSLVRGIDLQSKAMLAGSSLA
jgi:hypothetical protein